MDSGQKARSWRIVADEVSKEQDTKRMTDLLRELEEALGAEDARKTALSEVAILLNQFRDRDIV